MDIHIYIHIYMYTCMHIFIKYIHMYDIRIYIHLIHFQVQYMYCTLDTKSMKDVFVNLI